MSIDARDPDGNLPEFIAYPTESPRSAPSRQFQYYGSVTAAGRSIIFSATHIATRSQVDLVSGDEAAAGLLARRVAQPIAGEPRQHVGTPGDYAFHGVIVQPSYAGAPRDAVGRPGRF